MDLYTLQSLILPKAFLVPSWNQALISFPLVNRFPVGNANRKVLHLVECIPELRVFANRSNFFASLACAFTSLRKDRKQPSLPAPRRGTKWTFNSTPGPSRPHTLYHAYQLEEQKHPQNVDRRYEKSRHSQVPFNIVDALRIWSHAAPLMCRT